MLSAQGMTPDRVKERKGKLAVWVREGLVKLGPTFIKIGQQFSTRVDVLSPEFVKELEKLQVCNTLHPLAHCCNLLVDNTVKRATCHVTTQEGSVLWPTKVPIVTAKQCQKCCFGRCYKPPRVVGHVDASFACRQYRFASQDLTLKVLLLSVLYKL